VEARPPFREGDSHAASTGVALETRHDLARRGVVAEKVRPLDDVAGTPGGAHPEREELRAAHDAGPGQEGGEVAGAGRMRDDELHRASVARAPLGWIEEKEPRRRGEGNEGQTRRDGAPSAAVHRLRRRLVPLPPSARGVLIPVDAPAAHRARTGGWRTRQPRRWGPGPSCHAPGSRWAPAGPAPSSAVHPTARPPCPSRRPPAGRESVPP